MSSLQTVLELPLNERKLHLFAIFILQKLNTDGVIQFSDGFVPYSLDTQLSRDFNFTQFSNLFKKSFKETKKEDVIKHIIENQHVPTDDLLSNIVIASNVFTNKDAVKENTTEKKKKTLKKKDKNTEDANTEQPATEAIENVVVSVNTSEAKEGTGEKKKRIYKKKDKNEEDVKTEKPATDTIENVVVPTENKEFVAEERKEYKIDQRTIIRTGENTIEVHEPNKEPISIKINIIVQEDPEENTEEKAPTKETKEKAPAKETKCKKENAPTKEKKDTKETKEKKEKKTNKPTVVKEPKPEPEYNENEVEEEIETRNIIIDGENYLIDNNGNIYDYHTHEHIGEYDSENNAILD
jgi:hypothetical protein